MCIPEESDVGVCTNCFPIKATDNSLNISWILKKAKWRCGLPDPYEMLRFEKASILESKYADPTPIPEEGDVIGMAEFLKKLQPGTPLVFVRKNTVRSSLLTSKRIEHWALYYGFLEGTPFVIHRYGDLNETPAPDSGLLRRIFRIVGSVYEKTQGKAEIRIDRLEDILHIDHLHCLKVGSCHTEMDKDACRQLAVEKARLSLGQAGYDLVFDNCETFVRYCMSETFDYSYQSNNALFTNLIVTMGLAYIITGTLLKGWKGFLLSFLFTNLHGLFLQKYWVLAAEWVSFAAIGWNRTSWNGWLGVSFFHGIAISIVMTFLMNRLVTSSVVKKKNEIKNGFELVSIVPFTHQTLPWLTIRKLRITLAKVTLVHQRMYQIEPRVAVALEESFDITEYISSIQQVCRGLAIQELWQLHDFRSLPQLLNQANSKRARIKVDNMCFALRTILDNVVELRSANTLLGLVGWLKLALLEIRQDMEDLDESVNIEQVRQLIDVILLC